MDIEISNHGHIFPGRYIAKCFGYGGDVHCPECAHDACALGWLHHLSGIALPVCSPGAGEPYYQALRPLGFVEWVLLPLGPYEGWQITPAGRDFLAQTPWTAAKLAAEFDKIDRSRSDADSLAGAARAVSDDATARQPSARIPITAARRIATDHGQRQVVIVTWDGARTHVVTYGATGRRLPRSGAGREQAEGCAGLAAGNVPRRAAGAEAGAPRGSRRGCCKRLMRDGCHAHSHPVRPSGSPGG